ncbi:MAG TPA: peptide chain release factor N(5)-glutamine methyltransferase [Ignavibacteria bacterium]|nr:peptide chain release factor N(5)-glutamine methyltransferase [Ignavibacteria bacterium]HMR40131.1 peptide chain release factor N(5)-glutamine methyltransferase [Ignavibacteria bacterium]
MSNTVLNAIKNISAKLSGNNIPDARLNAELFLCHVLKCDRVGLYINFDKPLNREETELLKNFTDRRIAHEPLQYIIGTTSFFGYDIRVNKDVLIPRPETELLADIIINDIKKSNKKKISIFEIGTGSACIPIAIARSLQKEEIDLEIFSIDISGDAIKTATENLELNGLNQTGIRLAVKDVFQIDKLKKDFDYIISNPPYISEKEYRLLDKDVLLSEPKIALTDSGDGLNFFRRIFRIASDNGFTGRLFLETGFGQKEDLEKLMKEYNFRDFMFYKDYNGIDRILEVSK